MSVRAGVVQDFYNSKEKRGEKISPFSNLFEENSIRIKVLVPFSVNQNSLLNYYVAAWSYKNSEGFME